MGSVTDLNASNGVAPKSRAASSNDRSKVTNLEDALLILSPCFCGTRWIESDKYRGFSKRFETTTMMLHRDQIQGEYTSAAVVAERTFQLLHVAADIGPESFARLIISEFHELQISCVRVTEYWPDRPALGQELSPATVVVVLQTDRAREAATYFHNNDKFHVFFSILKALSVWNTKALNIQSRL